jgi:hypothetical protein
MELGDPIKLRAQNSSNRPPGGSRLNSAFFRERAVVPLEWCDRSVTVGMADPTDEATIAALRFATGCEIVAVAMPLEEINERLAAPTRAALLLSGSVARSSGFEQKGERGRPLSSLAGDWIKARDHPQVALATLVALLSAGYVLSEAGAVVVAAHGRGQPVDPAELALAERLRSGEPLETAMGDAEGLPRWLVGALTNLPAGANYAAALVGLVAVERTFSDRRTAARRLLAEIALLAVPSIVAWWAVSVPLAVLVAVMALAALGAVDRSNGEGPNSPFVRACVLDVVAVLAGNRMPPAAAIRCGLERLQASTPTWGRVPDTRDELSRALRLEPMAAAMLVHGSLDIAAGGAARECGQRGLQSLSRVRWIVRLSAIALFGLALGLIAS